MILRPVLATLLAALITANPDSLLDITKLVIVDPVGSGFSKALGKIEARPSPPNTASTAPAFPMAGSSSPLIVLAI
jgi:hypothetical protein